MLTDPVYVLLFNPTVTVCPSSIPLVATVTVPLLLSYVAFNTVPQLRVIELIDGLVLSYTNVVDDCEAALPASSLTSAVIVFVPSVNA